MRAPANEANNRIQVKLFVARRDPLGRELWERVFVRAEMMLYLSSNCRNRCVKDERFMKVLGWVR